MSDPATESYITIFRNSGVAGIPCSEWEISDVQRELGVELPPAYKAFLAIAGNGFEPLEGSLYAGEDNLSELQRAGRRIAADEKTALLPGAFVFLVHQGFQQVLDVRVFASHQATKHSYCSMARSFQAWVRFQGCFPSRHWPRTLARCLATRFIIGSIFSYRRILS